MLAEPGKERRKRQLIGAFLCAACSAAVLLALHAAMMPIQVDTASTQIYQLDSLISNGRATIATQLPMTVLLFVSMLILLLFELFLSSALIQRVFGCRRGGFCVGFSCAAAIGLAVSGALYGVPLGFLDRWTPAVVCIPLLLEVAGQRIERSV